MERIYNYESEDAKKYEIKIKCSKRKIRFRLKHQSEDNKIYYFLSMYRFLSVKRKCKKIIDFKNISSFVQCLVDNIKNKKLVIKPIYKNIMKTIWKIFPNDSKEESFTLISNKHFNKKLSLFFFSDFKRAEHLVKQLQQQEYLNLKEIKKNNNILDHIYSNGFLIENSMFLNGNFETEEEKKETFFEMIKENNSKKNKEYRNVLVFFDEPNLEDIIIETSKKFYKEQIFIIIIYSKIVNELKSELEYRINKFTETRKTFFDMNNIFILSIEDYEKIYIPLLKVYNYFNQLGDGFYLEIQNSELQIKGFEEEFHYLDNTHYFNILLCGLTGSGKSTFINTLMGEKKAFTLNGQSAGTYRNNFYIHKKYPIKIIDVCGFADGTEGKSNSEKLSSIYEKNNKNIIIDEYINDIFTFYGDKRNNIHLLLYFNIYNNKYDVLPGELPFIELANNFKIPIIFVVNKCEDKIFNDEMEMEELMDAIAESRKGKFYEKFQTVCLNCIKKNGFDQLLSTIYDNYKKYIVSNSELDDLKNNIFGEDLKKKFIRSIFFETIKPDDIILNESLLTSIKDIKTLLVKIAGYYENKLNFLSSISYFFSKFYNEMKKNENTNCFPLLTDLIQKIYRNFGIIKQKDECNKFIKKKILEYFQIDPKSKETEDLKKNKEFNKYDFIRDCNTFGNLFWNSDFNYKLKETIEKDWLDAETGKEEEINNENNIIEKKKSFKDSIFEEEDENQEEIDSELILEFVKRDFCEKKQVNQVNLTPKQKMKVKLFYVSYISNELINTIFIRLKKEGFEFKSICDFYYRVSCSYNSAINGFNEIKEELNNIKMMQEEYSQLKKQGIGKPPNTIIVGNLNK